MKHHADSALSILSELKQYVKNLNLKKEAKQSLQSTVTYFENNYQKMNYHENVTDNLPIGSGVTEAACKTLIKQRFCQSGMRWKTKGMKIVLSLRQLIQSKGRWQQFWDKINQQGVPNYAQ